MTRNVKKCYSEIIKIQNLITRHLQLLWNYSDSQSCELFQRENRSGSRLRTIAWKLLFSSNGMPCSAAIYQSACSSRILQSTERRTSRKNHDRPWRGRTCFEGWEISYFSFRYSYFISLKECCFLFRLFSDTLRATRKRLEINKTSWCIEPHIVSPFYIYFIFRRPKWSEAGELSEKNTQNTGAGGGKVFW